jgi:hypothetical protein
LLRRMPMKRKRESPRRKAPERVSHRRVKPRAKSAPTAAEQQHMNRIAGMPCLGCGRMPVEVHHSLTAKGKIRRRDHRFVCPLCPACHRGPRGVHGTSERAFSQAIGIDLGEWAVAQWEASCE